MSIEQLMDHKCDIYHLQTQTKSKNYGLPSTKEFNYNIKPDLSDIDCHFKASNQNINIIEPQRQINETLILKLPLGTDVRLNDKIVNRETLVTYYAKHPLKVRDNHIKVEISTDREYL